MTMTADKKTAFLLVAILVLTTIPFLGLTDFNTKGEPREAIVAYTMIDSGNWILPTNSGGETAYKPPFFHWLIALTSKLNGGIVTEFTSRFPSALASILMLLTGFMFYSKRKNSEVALLAAMIAFTTFEFHRSTFACRVDMLLTACIVCALYFLFRWTETGCRKVPLAAIILMGLGVLTKGPVAILLPCLVTGTFLLLRGMNFWRAFFKLLFIAIVSLIIPAIWYVAAYQQGGDDFMRLVKEENIDRFLGKMSYESHENPWTYNVVSVVSGFIPWTILLFISLFGLSYRKYQTKFTDFFQLIWKKIRTMDAYRLFSLLAVLIIFVFYCIPKSKRSVYLLPIYPFLAYFIAEYFLFLYKRHLKYFKAFGHLLAVIGITFVLLFIAIKGGLVPDSIFHGKHAAENIAYLQAISEISSIGAWLLLLLPVVGSVCWWRTYNKHWVWGMILLLYLSMDGVFQPAVLNVKSDLPIAKEIEKIVPSGPIMSYVETEMLHFYVINFYEKNRVEVFNDKTATTGYLIVGEKDAKDFLLTRENQFNFRLCYTSGKRSCDVKQKVLLYQYTRK